MAVAVILPKLDEAMLTGRIIRWMKKEGGRVEKGESILEIETEKVTFEVEAEESGILSKIMAKAGDDVPVGATIAFILQAGEKAPEVPEPVVRAKAELQVEIPRVTKEAEAIEASPLAKRIAEEEMVPLSPMREVIAKRMTESFQAPHFYMTVEVDTQELGKTRKQLIPFIESKIGIRLTVTDLIIKIGAKALEDNPSVNCAYVDGAVKLFKRIDIGLVTAVEGGLVVPVIQRANKRSLAEIAQARAELVQKARERKLSMEEMRGSTFTISNAGMYEVDQFSAILQPPEAAIVAVGRIKDRAVVREGEIVIRPMMTLTLSIDHRVLDTVIGANFLQSLKNYIENPFSMLL